MVDRRRWRSRVARCAARCSAQADCRSSPRLGVTPGHECSRAVLDLPKLSHENLSGSTRGRRSPSTFQVALLRLPASLRRIGAADKEPCRVAERDRPETEVLGGRQGPDKFLQLES